MKRHRVPTAFLREQYRARYRMFKINELMPLGERPHGDWIAALLAFAPFGLFIVAVIWLSADVPPSF